MEGNHIKEAVVYSGSFNPFHIGHMAIVKELSEYFDEVYLVVSVQNPLKTEQASDFSTRLETVRKAVEKSGLTNVIVEDIEATLEPPFFTVNTLEALEAKYPDIIFWFCVGGDCLENMEQWYEWEKLFSHYGLVIIPREGYDHMMAVELLKDRAECPEYWHCAVIKADIPQVSSTEIREKLARGESVAHLIP